MSEDQLYELAQRRIDRRNRRWLLWGLNFLGLMSWFAFVAAFSDRMPDGFGEMIAIIWMGVFVLHGIVAGLAQTRDGEIEREVLRLRQMLYDEKPKRLALSEDGELVDAHFEADLEPIHKRRGDSV